MQDDRPAVALGRGAQDVAERAQLGLAVDPPGRVVRRVDDDRPGPRRDRRGDGVDVEVEGGRARGPRGRRSAPADAIISS